MHKFYLKNIAIVILTIIVIISFPSLVESADNNCPGLSPVKLGKKVVFCVDNEKRAERITERLEKIAENRNLNPEFLIYNPDDIDGKRIEIPYLLFQPREKDIINDDNISDVFDNIREPEIINENTDSLVQKELLYSIKDSLEEYRTQEKTNKRWAKAGIVISGVLLLFVYYFWARQEDILVKDQWSRGISTGLTTVFLVIFFLSMSPFLSKFVDNYFVFSFPVGFGLVGGFYASLESLKKSKVETALEYINMWDSSDLQTARDKVIDEYNKKTTGTDEEKQTAIREIYEDQSDTFDKYLKNISNFWYKIHILYQNNLADKQMLKNAFGETYKNEYKDICMNILIKLDKNKDHLANLDKHLK